MVCSTVCSFADKKDITASLAFVSGIHRGLVNSPYKGPVTRKKFSFDDVIMLALWLFCICSYYPSWLSYAHVHRGIGSHLIRLWFSSVDLNQHRLHTVIFNSKSFQNVVIFLTKILLVSISVLDGFQNAYELLNLGTLTIFIFTSQHQPYLIWVRYLAWYCNTNTLPIYIGISDSYTHSTYS